jgi:2'-5' RNA ligase
VNQSVATTARRLFFALWPDSATRDAIRKVTRTAVRRCGGRPVPADNYHITLAFLGSQPVALFDDIVAAGRAVSEEPLNLELELDRFGYWPKPRVFWFGPADCPPALAAVARRLWARLAELGVAGDARVLQPHVTLCRKVQRAPQLDPPAAVRWPIAGFALVESVTAPQGAEYTVVARFPP